MGFRDLLAFKKAFRLAVEIHSISKNFPAEEKYSLTDQIRRSSRSVCANIGESYRKRRYEKHFISKLTDSDAENTETQIWSNFALEFNYIDKNKYDTFIQYSEEVGKLLSYMMSNPKKFS